MLKKFFTAILAASLILFAASEKVFAADVWVAEENGTNIYIMTDTIVHKAENDWEGLWVVTKKVRGGKTESTTKWTFDVKNWRYSTSNMRTEHTSIISEGSLAEKILNKSLQYI